jgi:SAM-dependent methyltransferase
MARGPLAAAGGLYEADLVADALASVGVDIARIRAGLDFGCSSGRVVRVLASAFPDVAWHGCDPNEPAIAWARETLPGIRFFRSPDRPPLELPDSSLDLVYAISIWSHFEPTLGLAWLEETRRVLRPGGHLVMTTHGTTTIEHDAARELRTPEQLAGIADALATHSTWYGAEFGEAGDWGVMNPDWGTAFVTAEWVLAHLLPQWQVVEFAPGRNAGNQDVYVLRRN